MAKRDNYQQIILAAKQLFLNYGISKTTIEDIAKAVGKGKSSLYYYFTTKEEIIEAVLVRERQAWIEQINKEIALLSTSESKLKLVAHLVTAHIEDQKDVFLQILKDDSDFRSYMPIVRQLKEKYKASEYQMINIIISDGINSGEFSEKHKDKINHFTVLFLNNLKSPLYFRSSDCSEVFAAIAVFTEMFIRFLKNSD
ncbi:MAG: TetR/AcrR family transcriptional regulator [Flavipsychrobacter sp.]|nr:TetR/AcrR family transcriptional regulator [Flavipsychrobacter sp.]